MNTYACWYHGRFGYCFEHTRSGWWFVPEQSQNSPGVHRNLCLQDFLFASQHDWQFELNRHQQPSLWRRLLSSMFAPLKPQTVAGLLLLPSVTRQM